MLQWLLPHNKDFFIFFERHISLATEAAQELLILISEKEDILESTKRIEELEHQADSLTHECIGELHKTFITPFQREDIHRLISKMDDIIDFIEDIAKCLVTYKLQDMMSEAQQLSALLLQAVQEIEKIVKKLKNFRSTTELESFVTNIRQIEHQADTIYLLGIGKLFDQTPDILLIIKWKEIYEKLENAIDRCEDVSNIIEGILLESV